MSRPTYVREEHKRRELELKPVIERYWKCRLEPTDTFCGYDFVVWRGDKVRGYIEVRGRNITSDHWDAFMISMKKVELAQQMKLDKPYIVLVKFVDKVMWLNMTICKTYKVNIGGRGKTPRDEQDRELCAFYPMSELQDFKEIKEG